MKPCMTHNKQEVDVDAWFSQLHFQRNDGSDCAKHAYHCSLKQKIR